MRELVARITYMEYVNAARTSSDAKHIGKVDAQDAPEPLMVMEDDKELSGEDLQKYLDKINNTPMEIDIDDDNFKFENQN